MRRNPPAANGEKLAWLCKEDTGETETRAAPAALLSAIRESPQRQPKDMDQFRVIKHPLDEFSFSNSVGGLSQEGRDALDMIMMLIGDMRFRGSTVQGTCARYFLLIDTNWVPKLCLFAQMNLAKLREYLWRRELECEDRWDRPSDNSQIALLFPEQHEPEGIFREIVLRNEEDSRTPLILNDVRMAGKLLKSQAVLR